jgi:hypothetical protein
MRHTGLSCYSVQKLAILADLDLNFYQYGSS